MRRWLAGAALAVACAGAKDTSSADTCAAGCPDTDTPGGPGPTDTEPPDTHDSAVETDDTADTEDTAPPRPDGVVWTFDEVPDGDALDVAADTSGNGWDAVAEGPLPTLVGARPGRTAAIFADDGVALVLAAPDADVATDLDAGEPLLVEVAFRTAWHGAGDGGVLVSRGDAGGDGWSLEVRAGRPVFALRSGGDVQEVGLARLVADDRWHRVTAGRDADGALVLAADGVEVATGPVVAGAVDASGDLRVGELRGRVDEVRVHRQPPALPSPTPERDVVRVFSAGEAPAGGVPAVYDTVRIPAIVQTASGALIAVAEGRVHNACDWGDVDAIAKRSTDGGRTWSDAQVVVDPGVYRVGNPVPIADQLTGAVYLVTSTYALDPDTCDGGTDDCICEAVGDAVNEVRVSLDDGLTWGPPVDITASTVGKTWTSITHGPGHGFQRADGTLVIPGAHRLGDGSRGGHLLTSADGAVWEIGLTQDGGDVNTNESSAAELDDGAIVITTRNQYGSSDVTWERRVDGLRGQAGVTAALEWATDPPYTLRPEIRGPVVFGSILHLPDGVGFGDEARTALSFPAGEHGSNYGQRHDLRLWTSEDGAATWREGARLHGHWAAYSDLAPLGDGGLAVLFEGAALEGDEITYYDHIDLLRLARPPLDDLTVAAWTFEGDDPALAAGPSALRLEGGLTPVAGEHDSTALSFTGTAPICADAEAARGWLDFGIRDRFEVEATFRTTSHTSGGSAAAGALVTRTQAGSIPAWWLRVQDGKLRFLVGSCESDGVNCGIIPGYCDALTDCVEVDVWSEEDVGDGAWHTVTAGRDPIAGELYLSVDGGPVATRAFDVRGVVKNDEPPCLGGFADGVRLFDGDLDAAVIRIGEAR